jgi:predicted nucleic acid-binding Zn ribbon protein
MKSELDESFERLMVAFGERQKRLEKLSIMMYGLYVLIIVTTVVGATVL